MTLGLIIIEEVGSLKETISILDKNKERLISICSSYLIHTTHNKADFLGKLSSINALYSITYDVADDIYLNEDILKDFHTLIYLNSNGIQYD